MFAPPNRNGCPPRRSPAPERVTNEPVSRALDADAASGTKASATAARPSQRALLMRSIVSELRATRAARAPKRAFGRNAPHETAFQPSSGAGSAPRGAREGPVRALLRPTGQARARP